MTITQALIAFNIAAGLLTVTPGLDTALVLRTAAVEGARRAIFAGLGICGGLLVWAAAVSVGLGALLTASRVAYQVLQIAGACYLLYLGLKLLFRRHHTSFNDMSAGSNENVTASGWYLRGLMTNLLNPKVGVFYVTFLPQFIPAGVNVVTFSLLLALIHAAQGMLWFACLTLATRPLSRWLQRPSTTKILDRVTGIVLVGFGVDLFLKKRPAL
jgi:threonine/homoserine/homoserine lactone efflux protein